MKDTALRMIPGRTRIGTVRGKYEGAVDDYDIYYGNIAAAPDGTLVHMDRARYMEVLDRFLESEEGRQYRRPSGQEILEAEKKFYVIPEEEEQTAEEMTAAKEEPGQEAKGGTISLPEEDDPVQDSAEMHRKRVFAKPELQWPQQKPKQQVQEETLFPGIPRISRAVPEKKEETDSEKLIGEIRKTGKKLSALEVMCMLFFIVLALSSFIQLAITAGLVPPLQELRKAEPAEQVRKDTAVEYITVGGETVGVPVIETAPGSSDIQLYAVITEKDEYGMYERKTVELGKMVMSDRRYSGDLTAVQTDPDRSVQPDETVPPEESPEASPEPVQATGTDAAGISQDIPQQ